MKKLPLLLLLLIHQPAWGVLPASSSPPLITSNAPSNDNLSPPVVIPAEGATPPIPKEILQMSPEQRDNLLQQAKTLDNDQLQAIARNFHQQLNPQDPSISTPSQEAPISPAQKADKLQSVEALKREQAFNLLLEDVMPMSPEQIIQMHKYYDITLQAKATPPTAPPTPQFTSTVVHLEPGSMAPVIRLAAGFVTSILFIDATGAPWPITAYSIGDPQNFNIQWNQKDNTLFIQSLKVYSHANMAVRLYGLDTPVVLTLVSGQKTVDFRVDLQIGERGPDAKVPIIDVAFGANVNPLMINVLDGVPPRGSIKLKVIGGPADAWLYDNKVYFRTKLTVLSPAWVSSVSSPDGTHVYEMMLTPYIVATHEGKTVDIRLSGL
jgi:intracellular multiplication protein IcmK